MTPEIAIRRRPQNRQNLIKSFAETGGMQPAHHPSRALARATSGWVADSIHLIPPGREAERPDEGHPLAERHL